MKKTYILVLLLSLINTTIIAQEFQSGDFFLSKVVLSCQATMKDFQIITKESSKIKTTTASVLSDCTDDLVMSKVKEIILDHSWGFQILRPWNRMNDAKILETTLFDIENQETLTIKFNNGTKQLMFENSIPLAKETPLSDILINKVIIETEGTIEKKDTKPSLTGTKSILVSIPSIYDETLIKLTISNVIKSTPDVQIDEAWQRDSTGSIHITLVLGTVKKEFLIIGYVEEYQYLQFVYQ